MVSEGVDIPRLRVGVYATSARTELFFRQVVGRFTRRTPSPHGQISHLFMPADPTLRRLAGQVEEERHGTRSRSSRSASRSPRRPGARRSSRATHFAARSGRARTARPRRSRRPSPATRFQLFGAPPPSPALAAFTAPASAPAAAPSRPAAETGHERRERLRAERGALVSALARLTGEPHRTIHARVNRETGARSVTAASTAQLLSAATRCSSGRRRGDAERVRRRALRARPPHAATPIPDTLPEWTAGTVAILSTGGCAAPSPVSTGVRAGPRSVLLALGRRRESLARLREDPRCALTLLAAGDVAVTAHGRAAVVADPLAASDGVVAVRIEVEWVQDHCQDTFRIDAGVEWHWTDEDARSGATPRSAPGSELAAAAPGA